MFKKNLKNEKGFTLIELIIVIAIIAIISAILAPSFARMTARSRLKADISSARELTREAALYNADKGTYPSAVTDLVNDKYIDSAPTPQTRGATFVWDGTNNRFVVDVHGDQELTQLIGTLSADEKSFAK
ncbi:MAG TPA: prepilin-type N-terminal cleavage/methylation domain-containing protein [Defluviitaleaceae bacterium]|nr:prepilin-type N-terminal cleavage/methylation domain-containing protein [Defluviitaleaceae bacterium]